MKWRRSGRTERSRNLQNLAARLWQSRKAIQHDILLASSEHSRFSLGAYLAAYDDHVNTKGSHAKQGCDYSLYSQETSLIRSRRDSRLPCVLCETGLMIFPRITRRTFLSPSSRMCCVCVCFQPGSDHGCEADSLTSPLPAPSAFSDKRPNTTAIIRLSTVSDQLRAFDVPDIPSSSRSHPGLMAPFLRSATSTRQSFSLQPQS